MPKLRKVMVHTSLRALQRKHGDADCNALMREQILDTSEAGDTDVYLIGACDP